MATIFISYSLQESSFVEKCIKLLNRFGHQCVYDKTIPPGALYEEELQKVQSKADGSVFFLTKNTQESSRIAYEISMAQNLAEQQEKFLIPVASTPSYIPSKLSRYQWIRSSDSDDPSTIAKQINDGILAWEVRRSQANQESALPLENQPDPSPVPQQQKVESTPVQEKPAKYKPAPRIRKEFPYWLIKVDKEVWGVHTVGYFIPRSSLMLLKDLYTYDNFGHVRDGDRILIFVQNGVAERVSVRRSLDEDTISLTVEQIFNPIIPLKSIQSLVPFASELVTITKPQSFNLTEEQYNQILTFPRTTRRFNATSFTTVHADIPSANIVDRLGFEKDVAALASVMAYTKVQPPLAIGLFGNWGSGKSFFMNKLEERIKELSKPKGPDYCQEIIHIKFNSWHYSDSNLWASMITKIFEDIEKHHKGPNNELQSLFANLNSAKELLADAQDEKIKVEGQIETLATKQKDLETKISKAKQDLEGVSYLTIAQAVFHNTFIQNKLKAGKEKLSALNSDDFAKVQDNLAELNTAYGQIKHTLRIALNFRYPRPFVALVFAVLIFLTLKWFFETQVIINFLTTLGARITKWLLFVSTAIVTVIRPAMQRLKRAQIFLKEVKAATDAEATKLYQAQKAGLEAELKSAQNQKAELGTTIGALEGKKASIEQELVAIQSGRRLAKFIEGRVTDERYVNSLGIISWIRKDFEELDHLLTQQREADKLEALTQTSTSLRIDRIILYIDDLDRCEVPIVVKVLEAIHLLLAFPLFVVVVGVDPRWMHNALRTKYQTFLATDKQASPEDEADPIILGKPATSYDYLEKIFQIPFVLKPMNKQGKDDLIAAQFSTESPSTATPPPINPLTVTPSPSSTQNPGPESGSTSTPPPNAGATEQKQTPAPSREMLTVSPEEIKFMQSIGYLVGDSPRNIKRYINIYRIIRTHSNFEFLDDNIEEDHNAAMILLGILLSISDNAKEFFQQLSTAHDDDIFIILVSNFLNSTDTDDFRTINAPLRLLHDAMQTDSTLKTIATMRLQKFKHNAALICRFSFRDVS